jgi:hypothetical protein
MNMKRRRKGTILVLVCLSFVLLVALAALSVDFGWMSLQEARLRKACNAAAAAGANKAVSGGTDAQIRTAAKNFATACGVTLADADILINPLGNSQNLVKIVHQETIGLFFAPLLGTPNLKVGYTVSGLGMADSTPLFSEPLSGLAASGLIPLYVPHADLLPVLTGAAYTKSQLAALIFGTNQSFSKGQRYMLKAGAGFYNQLRQIIGPTGNSQEGGLDFPGQAGGAYAFETYFKNGFGGRVSVGDILTTEPGTLAGPTKNGVDTRYNQDPNAFFVPATNAGVQSLSARLVVVPIANAVQTGPDDAGTGVPNMRNIGYIWDGKLTVQVIGFAEFLLDAYSTSNGLGVVTGIFIRYVGTPPSGQSKG